MIPFQKPKERQTLNYQSGKTIIFDKIAYGGKAVRAWVRFFGTVNIVNAGALGTAIGDVVANLAQRVRVQVLPAAALGEYRVDCSGRALVRMAQQLDHKLLIDYNGTGAGTLTNGAGAAGNFAIDVYIPIIFGRQTALDLYRPEQGGKTTSLRVFVNCATLQQLWNGNAGTWDADNSLQVQWIDEREDSTASEVPLYLEDHQAQILAAKVDYTDNALPSTGTFLSMLILTETGGALQTLSDAVLDKNSITIQGGSVDMLECDPSIVKAAMIGRRGIDIGESRVGIHNIDFTGRFGHVGVDASTLAHKFAVKNPGGAGNDFLHICTRRVAATEAYLTAARAGARGAA